MSGVTSFTAKTEEEAMDLIKKLLSYIPSNNREEAPRVECTDPIDRKDDLLNEIIPDDPNQAYDMYKVFRPLPTMESSSRFSQSLLRTSSLVSLVSMVRVLVSLLTSHQHTQEYWIPMQAVRVRASFVSVMHSTFLLFHSLTYQVSCQEQVRSITL